MQKSTAHKVCCVPPERMSMQQRCTDWTTPRSAAFRYYRRGLNSALATLATNAHGSLLRATGRLRNGGSERPAPVIPVPPTNLDFQIEFVPADGIRLPFSGSGDLGTSPFFGQLSVKVISLTVSQRTILVA
jgi:hypothetical protein